MNEELEKQLAKAIEQGLSIAEKTGEFVLDQAPDLIQQFLIWHTYSHVFWIIFGAFLLVAAILPRFLGDTEGEGCDIKFYGRYFPEEPGLGLWFISIVTQIIGLIVIAANTYYLIMITTAPKIYMIEYFLK